MANIPAIGIAKDPLLKKAYSVGTKKGDRAEFYGNKELIRSLHFNPHPLPFFMTVFIIIKCLCARRCV